jgi:hypothetical protein
MAHREVVICSPVRTAIGTYGGSLKDTPAVDLGAAAVRATLARANVSPDKVSTVVMGNVIQAGNKMNPARQAAINGGLPVEVPAMTVNRVCGSGAQAGAFPWRRPGRKQAAATEARQIACEASWMSPRLLDFVLAIFDVFLCDRIVLFLLQLIGLRARVLPGHVIVAGARAGNQLDLETNGFGHGIFP